LNFYVKICQRSYIVGIIFTILLLFVPGSALASSGSPYDSGYNHGCDDAGISDSSDRYINQPEKGPSFHTSEFMNGYYAGIESCSGFGNSNDGLSSASSSSSSDTAANQILCYAAGGLAVLSGAPIETVIGAGQVAHQAGVCP
jgi:hypothetical protein